jgi:hypothetical protein
MDLRVETTLEKNLHLHQNPGHNNKVVITINNEYTIRNYTNIIFRLLYLKYEPNPKLFIYVIQIQCSSTIIVELFNEYEYHTEIIFLISYFMFLYTVELFLFYKRHGA